MRTSPTTVRRSFATVRFPARLNVIISREQAARLADRAHRDGIPTDVAAARYLSALLDQAVSERKGGQEP